MRLIDADELTKRITDWYCAPERCDNYNGVRCRACSWDDALNMIDEAPTIEKDKMIDRDKVIKGLESCINPKSCWYCPYRGEGECVKHIMSDVLELLKDPESKNQKDVEQNGD